MLRSSGSIPRRIGAPGAAIGQHLLRVQRDRRCRGSSCVASDEPAIRRASRESARPVARAALSVQRRAGDVVELVERTLDERGRREERVERVHRRASPRARGPARVRHPFRRGPPALRLHGQHLPLADRRGRDARAAARAGARGRGRGRQRRARAPGTSATRPTRARRPRRGRAASRSRARRARCARADFDDFDLILAADRRNLRDLQALAAARRARAKLHLLREFDPASAGAPDLDVPDPYYGGDDGFEHVLDLVEAACRGLLDDAARRRPAVIAGGRRRGASAGRLERARRVAGGDINDAWQLELEDGARAFVKTRAGARARRVRDRGRRRCAGSARPTAGSPVPEVLAVDDALPRARVDRRGAARRGGRGGARPRARARARGGRAGVRRAAAGRAVRRRCGSARSSCPAATGGRLARVLRRAPARAAAARGRRRAARCRRRRRGGRGGDRAAAASSPGPPEPPARAARRPLERQRARRRRRRARG